jgi:hypothetical protein
MFSVSFEQPLALPHSILSLELCRQFNLSGSYSRFLTVFRIPTQTTFMKTILGASSSCPPMPSTAEARYSTVNAAGGNLHNISITTQNFECERHVSIMQLFIIRPIKISYGAPNPSYRAIKPAKGGINTRLLSEKLIERSTTTEMATRFVADARFRLPIPTSLLQ